MNKSASRGSSCCPELYHSRNVYRPSRLSRLLGLDLLFFIVDKDNYLKYHVTLQVHVVRVVSSVAWQHLYSLLSFLLLQLVSQHNAY